MADRYRIEQLKLAPGETPPPDQGWERDNVWRRRVNLAAWPALDPGAHYPVIRHVPDGSGFPHQTGWARPFAPSCPQCAVLCFTVDASGKSIDTHCHNCGYRPHA